jgi:hypothetical protein
MGSNAANVTELTVVPAHHLQKILRLSPDTDGRKGDSFSAEKRALPLATATAAMTLAASLSMTAVIIRPENPYGKTKVSPPPPTHNEIKARVKRGKKN